MRPDKALPWLVAAGVISGTVSSQLPAAAETSSSLHVCLGDLDLSRMSSGRGKARGGQSVGGGPLQLKGQRYSCGVGTHAPSEYVLDLRGAARRFRALVGVDDEVSTAGSVEFHVYVDGRKVATSGVVRGGRKPRKLDVDLVGAKELRLVVTDGGDTIEGDSADWADAIIELDPTVVDGHSLCAACPIPAEPRPQAAPAIASASTPMAPALHGPRIIGGSPGRPFLFRIPATGERPLTFSATRLPKGLHLDPMAGLIRGVLETTGTSEIALRAENRWGAASRTLRLVAEHGKLALTPPLGWNSWNIWGAAVDDGKVRAAADALVRTGLADHGFTYVNIDDGWQGERDSAGVLRPNSRFPDMRALADYVHARGLKLGIYSSPGPRTCEGLPGSLGCEKLDAQTWADWGIDFLKYDWCSYTEIAGGNPPLPELQKPYRIMRQALDTTGRDIVFSICQYGMGEVWTWGAAPEIRGNLWRTTRDITDTWDSMASIGFEQDPLSSFASPGHWNDPDMLVVGQLGWGANPRPSRLTPHEQVTHLTLWSLLAAPLLLGCDLDALDGFTLALLTNDDVLEVNQDSLGQPARRRKAEGGIEIWSRPLADGALAVGVLNRTDSPTSATLRLSDFAAKGRARVRDLWMRRDMGEFEGEVHFEVAPHGARLLRLAGGE